MNKDTDTTAGKLFSELIQEAERGNLDHDLTREVNKVVKAVRETGNAGNVKLIMSIKPSDHAGMQVTLEHKIDSKTPQAPRMKTLAFTTAQGGLQREDPNQMVMKEVMQDD